MVLVEKRKTLTGLFPVTLGIPLIDRMRCGNLGSARHARTLEVISAFSRRIETGNAPVERQVVCRAAGNG